MLFAIISVSAPAADKPTAAEKKDLGIFIENRGQSATGHYQLIGMYRHQLTSSIGVYSFTEKVWSGSSWFEAYAGPTWKPASWLQFGVAAGREMNPNGIRYAGMFSATVKKADFFGVFENGASGPYRYITAVYHLPKNFNIGMMDEATASGIGPRVEYAARKNVTVWGATLYDRDTRKTNTTFAVDFSF